MIDYKNRLINFHPSILPGYKGLNAIDQAINDGALLLGNSAHLVTEKVDGGHVFMQYIIPANHFENYDQILDQQLPMLMQIIKWMQANRFKVIDDKVAILDAKYNTNDFFPNLEG